MSTANVSEPYKISTGSLEFLETFIGSLQNSSPSHDDFPI